MQLALNDVWRETRKLSRPEKMKLLERLIHQLRIEEKSQEELPTWDQMYGIGQGTWNMDAQVYVDELREERNWE
ncbi:MAG: hypothetical protein GY950_09205 [bacterium]|nr:hypothetical protein [bacterium]